MNESRKKIVEIYNSKKKDLKIIFKNIFSISLIRFFDYLIPLLTIPYIVRIIGVEKYGIIAMARAFVTYFLVFVTFGFNFSGTKFIAANRDNKKEISIETYNIIFIKLLFAVTSFSIILLLINIVPKFHSEAIVYLFTSINLFGEALFPVWLFQGLEKMDYITKITIPIRIFFTVLIFIFIKERNDFYLIPLFYALGPLFSGFVSIYIIFKVLKLRKIRFSLNRIKLVIKKAFTFFLSRISWNLVTSTDVLILGFVGGNYFAGIFSAARKLIKQINMLIQPLYASIFPYYSNTVKRKGKEDILLFRLIFILSTFGILIVVFFVFVFAKEIILIFLGRNFIEAVNILKLFLLVPFFYHINAIIGTAILIPNGYDKEFNNSVIISSIFHFIMLGIIFLLKMINPVNIVVLIDITYLILFILRIFPILYKKDLRKWFFLS